MPNDDKKNPTQNETEKDPTKVEIEPLSDEELEDVAGGSSGGCCSCSGCSSSDL